MPRKPPTQSIVNILHLSDLHRGHNAPTSNLVLQGRIKDDILKNYAQDNNRFQLGEPRLGPPDLIVISGDLTQRADPGEFQLAAEFLESLLELVGGERRRIILVPGNHDVNWNLSRLAFSEVSEQDYKDQPEFDDPYRQLVKKARDKPEYWHKDET